ncbi:GMC oxidoreductase [Popillia japonica]|uniref:GMC oxidoreductase n=1 Tax=Popillia japonica TaxID=7064 RepID=A0AAW1N3M0_POPJA
MNVLLKHLLLAILISTTHYEETTSEDVHDFIQSIRDKVINLEASGEIKRDYEPYKEPPLQDEETYDFIIVGAGSGGSALIHRLSEISDWKILVLEAGGEPDIITDIPVWSTLAHHTHLNWKFFTETEEGVAMALDGQRMHWPRGKSLGGSSILNYMIFSRGAKEDYDKWARGGNPGWSYKEVLPFFKKLETCKIHNRDVEYRGHDGPINVENAYQSDAAAQNAGYKNLDYNGKEHQGVSYCQATTKKGFRCSGERCYIRPVKNRKNLTIRLHSHVTKVLIKNKTAYGVQFSKDGKIYRAYARKEVILSAGVINSAHTLLLSAQLEKFGIELVEDLPVGQKIYDHPVYWGLGFTLDEPLRYNVEDALQDKAFKELYNEGTGILHDLTRAESLIFIKTPLATENVSDIELIFLSTHFSKDQEVFGGNVKLSKEFYNKMYKKYEDKIAVGCLIVLMHPESYGRMELKSADPFEYPRLYHGYFTDAERLDMRTMIAGIREAIRVMLSPPFNKHGIKLMDEPMVGCEQHKYDSDEYWECALRHLTSTLFHQTTTCKMGPANDPEAVVDNRLRVYGVNNLRVADTSVIPIQITGHTNVPGFLVGEMAANIIKTEHLGVHE